MAQLPLTLSICAATMRPCPSGVDLDEVVTLNGHPAPGDIPLAVSNASTYPQVYVKYNAPGHNTGVVRSYELLYRKAKEDVLCFLHDDCLVRERGWDDRVKAEFQDDAVALVGFGGALAHGHPDLYKVRYRLQNLIRYGYRSCVDDAEVHGERFTGSCDSVFIDGYCLIARRSFLDRINGFTSLIGNIDFFMYDAAMCALARRYGYKARVVGVRCHHRGGQSSVLEKTGIASPEAYEASHRWFYNEFKDVMPCRVNPQ